MISDDPALAAQKIRAGKLVIFPTETVYGIGADALNKDACDKIYELKKRPRDNPLIWHFSSWDHAKNHVLWSKKADTIASTWQNGPVTMVLNAKEKKQTIACRVPALKIARTFIDLCATPVAAPSANLSGRPSLTRFSDILSYFENKVALILKGPEPTLGLESTVIDLTREENIAILRPGHITRAELTEVLNVEMNVIKKGQYAKSPGTRYKHYSPDKPVQLVEHLPLPAKNMARMGFKMVGQNQQDRMVKNNLEYANHLYAFLENSDQTSAIETIYCQYPLDDNLKESLLNRLEKASNQNSGPSI